mmetsp:Transcript_19976/g.55624  ORF Transcript_19976/g.55624 Transcript_19976/m.55624 type:complete len:85 (-) Transcript_19976:958-1212(-)
MQSYSYYMQMYIRIPVGATQGFQGPCCARTVLYSISLANSSSLSTEITHASITQRHYFGCRVHGFAAHHSSTQHTTCEVPSMSR